MSLKTVAVELLHAKHGEIDVGLAGIEGSLGVAAERDGCLGRACGGLAILVAAVAHRHERIGLVAREAVGLVVVDEIVGNGNHHIGVGHALKRGDIGLRREVDGVEARGVVDGVSGRLQVDGCALAYGILARDGEVVLHRRALIVELQAALLALLAKVFHIGDERVAAIATVGAPSFLTYALAT